MYFGFVHTNTNTARTNSTTPLYELHHPWPLILTRPVLSCFHHVFPLNCLTCAWYPMCKHTDEGLSKSCITSILHLYPPQQQEYQQVLSCPQITAAIYRPECEDWCTDYEQVKRKQKKRSVSK